MGAKCITRLCNNINTNVTTITTIAIPVTKVCAYKQPRVLTIYVSDHSTLLCSCSRYYPWTAIDLNFGPSACIYYC